MPSPHCRRCSEIRLRCSDGAAEVEDGQVKQTFPGRGRAWVQHPAGGTPSTRDEWLPELIVRGGQHCVPAGRCRERCRKFSQLASSWRNRASPFRRRGVDDGAGAVVDQLRAGRPAHVQIHRLDAPAHFDRRGGGQRALAQRRRTQYSAHCALAQRRMRPGRPAAPHGQHAGTAGPSVVTMFSISELSRASSMGKVFTSIAGLGIKAAAWFKAAKGGSGRNAGLHRARFQLHGWRQRRQVVVGLIFQLGDANSLICRHVTMVCRRWLGMSGKRGVICSFLRHVVPSNPTFQQWQSLSAAPPQTARSAGGSRRE